MAKDYIANLYLDLYKIVREELEKFYIAYPEDREYRRYTSVTKLAEFYRIKLCERSLGPEHEFDYKKFYNYTPKKELAYLDDFNEEWTIWIFGFWTIAGDMLRRRVEGMREIARYLLYQKNLIELKGSKDKKLDLYYDFILDITTSFLLLPPEKVSSLMDDLLLELHIENIDRPTRKGEAYNPKNPFERKYLIEAEHWYNHMAGNFHMSLDQAKHYYVHTIRIMELLEMRPFIIR